MIYRLLSMNQWRHRLGWNTNLNAFIDHFPCLARLAMWLCRIALFSMSSLYSFSRSTSMSGRKRSLEINKIIVVDCWGTAAKPYRIVKPANASARKEPKTMGKWNFFIADMIPMGNKILGDPKSEGSQLNPTISSKNSYKTELAPNVNKPLRLRRQSSVGGSGGRNWDPLYQH